MNERHPAFRPLRSTRWRRVPLLVACPHCGERFEVTRTKHDLRFWAPAHGAQVSGRTLDDLALAVPLACPQSPANASGDE